MKKINFLIGILLLSVSAIAQLVSDNTNTIELDFEKSAGKTFNLPKIAWTFPGREYTNSQEFQVELKANISSGSPITEVIISIAKSEGGEVIGSKGLNVPANSYNYQVNEKIALSEGENVISIQTTNSEGGTVYSYRQILQGLDAISKAIDINRKDYALLIGTDKYDNWNDLVNPVYDVETIAKELEENYGFEIETLLNPEQEDILIKLKEYAAKKYRPQDQLLIFIAGHGQYDEGFGEGYLVTRGSLKNDAAKTSYIAHSVLRNVINNIPSEHTLLMMDVCFSGTFDPVIARNRSAVYDNVDELEFLVRKLSKKTRRYLTSGGKEYVSDGIPGQHSPFAKKFLEVLKTRGGEDRIITLTDIYQSMEKLQTLPRTGEFGDNEKDSDFVFVAE